MAFQGHCLTVYLPPIEQSMPYCPRASQKLFLDEENQALKILKRPFGYFLGASKKLPARLFPELKCGIKVGNTKRLNGSKYI
jgi:hypothetical protein